MSVIENLAVARNWFLEAVRCYHTDLEERGHREALLRCAQFVAYTEFFDCDAYYAARNDRSALKLIRRNSSTHQSGLEFLELHRLGRSSIDASTCIRRIRDLAAAYHEKNYIRYWVLLATSKNIIEPPLWCTMQGLLELKAPFGFGYIFPRILVRLRQVRVCF